MNKINRKIITSTAFIQSLVFITILSIVTTIGKFLVLYIALQYEYVSFEFKLWELNKNIIIE